MARNIVFEVEETASNTTQIPATQTQGSLAPFGGIRTFTPTVFELGGVTPLSALVGHTIAVTGGTAVELRSGPSFRWNFRFIDGEEGAFLSSSTNLQGLLPLIEERGAAKIAVMQGDSWVDKNGNTRPGYEFRPGE